MVSKQKILIVDDDNNIAELIALYLTKECFETKIVNDGEEALREFASFRPDLIILDLMLPGIDGYQVCREIRHTSDVPIIMLSAKGETFDKVLGLEQTIQSHTWVVRLICRQRNWNFSISLQHHQTRYLPVNSFWITSGVMNTSVIPVL